MSSTDGIPGVHLANFLSMWQEDGTQLVEQKREVLNGHIWLLYAIYFPQSTYDYGRHMALVVKVDAQTSEILMHDLMNLTGEVDANYRQEIDTWWERHVGQY